MPAGRPPKVPRRYLPLWVMVQPAIIRELDTLAHEIARQVNAGINVTRQDAARTVFDHWLTDRVMARREKKRTASA